MADDINTVLRRLDAVERNQTDHAKSITEFFSEASQIEGRVRKLEEIQHDRRVADAERCAREKAMQKDIETIRTDVHTIKGGINRVLWGIAMAVVLAAVGWALQGGPLGG